MVQTRLEATPPRSSHSFASEEEILRPNRAQGSRRGAAAPIGGILGIIVGMTLFSVTQSVIWIVIAPAVGVGIALAIAYLVVPYTPHTTNARDKSFR